jgi:hypothetical protein
VAIKLVTEVMDWAPPLTHREHKVLMILAENARLSTRQTWDSVESPLMLRRARLTRAEMYAVIGALVAKGCLDKPVWGGRNHRAKYAIAHLTDHDQCRFFPTLRTMISVRVCKTLRIPRRPATRRSQCREKPDPDSLVLQAGEKLAWKVQSQRLGRA